MKFLVFLELLDVLMVLTFPLKSLVTIQNVSCFVAERVTTPWTDQIINLMMLLRGGPAQRTNLDSRLSNGQLQDLLLGDSGYPCLGWVTLICIN
jgi:hypothetical protein